MENKSNLEALLEMGFSKARAEKALQETGNIGIMEAAEWLLSHEEKEDEEEEDRKRGNQAETPVTQCSSQNVKRVKSVDKKFAGGIFSNLYGDAKVKIHVDTDEVNFETVMRKCDDCGEIFRNAAEVSVHAITSGHSAFTQCSESLEPPTKEEEEQQIENFEKMMKQLEAEHIATTSQENLHEPHPNRSSLKRKQNDTASLSTVEQNSAPKELHVDDEVEERLLELKRKQMEDKFLRQRILQDIARDRQETKSKHGRLSVTSPASESVYEQQSTKKEFDTCRLQIRLTDGRTLTRTFSSKEELAAVRLYIDLNRTDGNEPFTLMTNFPKRIFTDEDMNCTLSHLGLPPSALIIVSKTRQCDSVR